MPLRAKQSRKFACLLFALARLFKDNYESINIAICDLNTRENLSY